jgi:hypothetical protein
MFALIETKGATHIAIAIPHENASRSLPALLGMLEKNATFIQSSYNELKTVEAKMTIELGNQINHDGREAQLAIRIPASEAVIDDSFQFITPEVLISNRQTIEAKEKELQRLRLELNTARQRISDLEESLKEALSEG